MYQIIIKKIYIFLPSFSKLIFKYKTYIKFFLTGFLTLLSDLFFLFIFHKVFLLTIVISTSLAFIISFLINFYLHKFWTFRDDDEKELAHQLFKYIFVCFLNLIINAKLMYLLVHHFAMFYLLAQTIVVFIIGVENFIIYNFVIFNKKSKINLNR